MSEEQRGQWIDGSPDIVGGLDGVPAWAREGRSLLDEIGALIVDTAHAALAAGDVIIIEQQTTGANGGCNATTQVGCVAVPLLCGPP